MREIAIVVLPPLIAGACWWGAVTLCEIMAARAEADGIDDWRDLFWPRMLRRVSAARYERLDEKMEKAHAAMGKGRDHDRAG